MPRVRKITKNPLKTLKNYFLVDACFLAEKYLPVTTAKTEDMKNRIREVKRWWKEIDKQVDEERARVYIPDVCIAEAFKVLAKKNHQEHAFLKTHHYYTARNKLANDITTTPKVLKSKKRHIKYHDMPTSRDVIISVDRFYELFMKYGQNVGVNDLLIVATAKYLMDFHDAQRGQIHIITMDEALWRGSKLITELPNAYDPSKSTDTFNRIFK